MTGYTWDESQVAHYVCRRVADAPAIDGELGKPPWVGLERSPRFVDMVTGCPGIYDTRAALTWDDHGLYVAFWVEEPFVRADLTERDALIFQENDVEIFIDGGDCYYELELNARNTVYEVFWIWHDACGPGSRFDVPEFDPRRGKALTYNVGDRDLDSFWTGRHPRGQRWAYPEWDLPGLRTAVTIDGTLNDDSEVDRGWTAEVALPWSGMDWLANGRSLPPKPGDVWRMYLGRFQKLTPSGIEVQPHPAMCWNRHGVYDTHIPECWTRIEFADERAS